LQLFLGEWFADTRIGCPYFQRVYVKNPDLASIGQLFRQIVLSCPGVANVLACDLSLMTNTRELSVGLTVETDTGAVLTGGLGVPFLVVSGGS
jgi:hypothetical protein